MYGCIQLSQIKFYFWHGRSIAIDLMSSRRKKSEVGESDGGDGWGHLEVPLEKCRLAQEGSLKLPVFPRLRSHFVCVASRVVSAVGL